MQQENKLYDWAREALVFCHERESDTLSLQLLLEICLFVFYLVRVIPFPFVFYFVCFPALNDLNCCQKTCIIQNAFVTL